MKNMFVFRSAKKRPEQKRLGETRWARLVMVKNTSNAEGEWVDDPLLHFPLHFHHVPTKFCEAPPIRS